MATSNESVSMALFCDFENVALGVRDAKYEKFDIKPVLERLLLKGSIVVKKAYCDWERYKGFKASMHEANFELIEIPHVRQSGKNSADIRLVVDALDLCYTKSHVDTFVIISGDSDFSPLVSKLRENAKRVIGVGVKQSTSDLLVANCDEFIFYDDLVRERQRAEAKRAKQDAQPASKPATGDDSKRRKDDVESRKLEAVEIAVETFDALVTEQGDSGKLWASVLKSAIKRRKPDFSEQYYGFRAFGNLLEEARARGLLDFGRDDRSGTFVFRPQESGTAVEVGQRRAGAAQPAEASETNESSVQAQAETRADKRDGRHRDRHGKRRNAQDSRSSAADTAPLDARPTDDATRTTDDATRATQEPVGHPEFDFGASPDAVAPADVHEATEPRESGGARKAGRRRGARDSRESNRARTQDGARIHAEPEAASVPDDAARRPGAPARDERSAMRADTADAGSVSAAATLERADVADSGAATDASSPTARKTTRTGKGGESTGRKTPARKTARAPKRAADAAKADGGTGASAGDGAEASGVNPEPRAAQATSGSGDTTPAAAKKTAARPRRPRKTTAT